MEDFTYYDIFKYYCSYLYDTYYLKMYPYKNVFIFDNSNNYNDDANIMNYISLGYEYDKIFPEKKRIVVSYSGNKEFYVSFYAQSYSGIKNIIDEILVNGSNYHNKIKTKFPDFIENINLIKKNTQEKLDIKHIIDKCISYDETQFTINDILIIVNEKKNTDSLNIVCVKKFRKVNKSLNIVECVDKDVSFLNEQ
jgi:hypothetical protein